MNAVRGRLSENYLTRKFIARNICDTKYLQFTVCCVHYVHVHAGGVVIEV